MRARSRFMLTLSLVLCATFNGGGALANCVPAADVSEIELLRDSARKMASEGRLKKLETATFSPDFKAFIKFVSERDYGLLDADGAIERRTVANQGELEGAIKALSRQGGVIELAPGTYANVQISKVKPKFPILIRSLVQESPAKIERIVIKDVHGMVLENLVIGRELQPGEALHTRYAKIQKSSLVGIVKSEFTGSVDGNFNNDGYGLAVTQSQGFVLLENGFHDLFRGSIISRSGEVLVRGNLFSCIRSDGMDFANVNNTVIEENFLHDFFPNIEAGDHSDGIQFWNNKHGSSRNIELRNNAIFQRGDAASWKRGGGVQGIFIGNKIEGAIYRDFVVERNVYYGTSSHGITIADIENAVIRFNTVLSPPSGIKSPGIAISKSRKGIRIENNVSSRFGSEKGIDRFSKNIEVTYFDPSKDTDVDVLFRSFTPGLEATIGDLVPMPGSLLETPTSIGALRGAVSGLGIRAIPRNYGPEGLTIAMEPVASKSFTEENDVAGYQWVLPDGMQVDGESLLYTLSEKDRASVELIVLDDKGRRIAGTRKVLYLPPPTLFSADLRSGPVDTGVFELPGSPIRRIKSKGGKKIKLDENSEVGSYGYRFKPNQFLGSMWQLSVFVGLRAAGGKKCQSGDETILWFHNVYGLQYDCRKNEVGAHLWLADGKKVRLTVPARSLADGEWHELAMAYDGATGELTVTIDGKRVGGETGLSGPVAGHTGKDLFIGGDTDGEFFSGDIATVEIRGNLIGQAAYGQSAVFLRQ